MNYKESKHSNKSAESITVSDVSLQRREREIRKIKLKKNPEIYRIHRKFCSWLWYTTDTQGQQEEILSRRLIYYNISTCMSTGVLNCNFYSTVKLTPQELRLTGTSEIVRSRDTEAGGLESRGRCLQHPSPSVCRYVA